MASTRQFAKPSRKSDLFLSLFGPKSKYVSLSSMRLVSMERNRQDFLRRQANASVLHGVVLSFIIRLALFSRWMFVSSVDEIEHKNVVVVGRIGSQHLIFFGNKLK